MGKIKALMETLLGRANGVATLDDVGNVPHEQLGNVSRPNLLHNWYFADPIDQRGRYVVKPGVQYYDVSDTSLSTPLGLVDGYYPVISMHGNYNICNDSGYQFCVASSDCVRGYTGAGYGIDRWWASRADVVVLVEDDGVSLQSYDWGEMIEGERIPLNTDMTFSILTSDGVLGYTTVRFNGTINQQFVKNLGDTGVRLNCLYGWRSSGMATPFFLQARNGAVKIRAAKLELGTTQTLAHQDADGNWVLNDPPPNKALELLKCQRYQLSQHWCNYPATFIAQDSIEFNIPIPVTMRANPSASGFVVRDGSGVNQSGFTFLFVAVSNYIKVVAYKQAHGLTSAYLASSADTILDANL